MTVRMFQRADWIENAACRDVPANVLRRHDVDTVAELFHPTRNNARAVAAQVHEAKRWCADCDVKTTCLDMALNDRSLHGIWGGLTHQERLKVRRQLGISQPRKQAS